MQSIENHSRDNKVVQKLQKCNILITNEKTKCTKKQLLNKSLASVSKLVGLNLLLMMHKSKMASEKFERKTNSCLFKLLSFKILFR